MTVIEAGEFRFWPVLESVTIPECVTHIGGSVFDGCTSLTSVTSLAENPPVCGNDAFLYSYYGSTLYVPYGCKAAYEAAKEWGKFDVIDDGTRTVTAEPNDADMGTVSGGDTYTFGAEATLTAIPNPDYHFVKWHDGNTENPRTLTVTQDITFTAIFAINTYTVTAEPNDADMGTVNGGDTYTFGAEATLTAIPNPDYHFVKWHDGNTENPRTLTVTQDTTFTAEFAINIYTVTLSVNDETMGAVSGGDTYTFGAEATLTAIPNPGYYFVRWDDGNTANPRILTVTEDITLTAIFAKDETDPSDPSDPLTPPTANEAALSAAPIAYVQGRTAYLADGLGEVEAFTATGQRVYRGTARTITLPRPGIYVLRVVADGRRCKVVVK